VRVFAGMAHKESWLAVLFGSLVNDGLVAAQLVDDDVAVLAVKTFLPSTAVLQLARTPSKCRAGYKRRTRIASLRVIEPTVREPSVGRQDDRRALDTDGVVYSASTTTGPSKGWSSSLSYSETARSSLLYA
jgi:hypothetical protein